VEVNHTMCYGHYLFAAFPPAKLLSVFTFVGRSNYLSYVTVPFLLFWRQERRKK